MPTETVIAKKILHRDSDDLLLLTIGKFPLLSPKEIALHLKRSSVQLRVRLAQFEELGWLQREEPTKERIIIFKETAHQCPKCKETFHERHQWRSAQTRFAAYYWYLTPEGAKQVPYRVVAWERKGNTVDHDRGLTVFHMFLDMAFGDAISVHQRRDNDMKQAVKVDGKVERFYPDFRFDLNGYRFYVEYTHSDPSSKNGKNDIDRKMERYNELLQDDPKAKVIFLFPKQVDNDRPDVRSFLNRYAEKFPYRWCLATDLESIREFGPKAHIFWCPKDFNQRTYAFSDFAA